METRSLLEAVVVARQSLTLPQPPITLEGELALLVFPDNRQLRHVVTELAPKAVVVSGWQCDLSLELMDALDALSRSHELIDAVVIENISLFYWELRQLPTTSATAWYTNLNRHVQRLNSYGIPVVVTMMDYTIDSGYNGEFTKPDVTRWLDVLAVPVAFAERFDNVVYISTHSEVDLSRKS